MIPSRMRRLGIAAAVAVSLTIGLAACGRSPAPSESTSTPPASAPRAATSSVRVFVSDETGGTVVVVDPDTGQVIERIAVGKRPRGLKISRDGAQLFVALSGSPIAGPGVDESKLPPPDRAADGIGVVDLASHKVLRTYDTGQDPETFDIASDGKSLYVSNE